ncbi:MAG: hypothetical protein ACLGI2_00545 [Acidimicrobiia bacterium]
MDPAAPDRHDDPAAADRPLLLDELSDRLEQLRLLGADDAATDRILADMGGEGRVEHEMVRELAARRPLAHPDRVVEAHGVAMRALEVLARNGSRAPSSLPRLGPLRPVAAFLVQNVIRYIVRQHQARVHDAIRDLYARRLGWTPSDHPMRLALVRARLDVERSTLSYKKNPGGIPTFLVGGAAVSSLAQGSRGLVSAAAGSRAGVVVAIAATFVLLAAVSWVILQGAAVARRRIRLTMDRPLDALWETVGWSGRPPRDNAKAFAVVAIVLTILGWLLLPLCLFLLFAVF